jgi:hypothetical protein
MWFSKMIILDGIIQDRAGQLGESGLDRKFRAPSW